MFLWTVGGLNFPDIFQLMTTVECCTPKSLGYLSIWWMPWPLTVGLEPWTLRRMPCQGGPERNALPGWARTFWCATELKMLLFKSSFENVETQLCREYVHLLYSCNCRCVALRSVQSTCSDCLRCHHFNLCIYISTNLRELCSEKSHTRTIV